MWREEEEGDRVGLYVFFWFGEGGGVQGVEIGEVSYGVGQPARRCLGDETAER